MITRIKHYSFRLTFSLVLCVLTLAAVVMATPAWAETYGGQAYAASVNAPTLGVAPVSLADTGPLSSTGGWEGAGAPGGNVPGVLSANVLNATTSGASGEASSFASLADITVFPGQAAQLTASFVLAQSHAGIGGGVGSVQIYDLMFGGLPVTISGLPNQTVSLPGVATLVINEQTISADGNNAVVNALRLTLVTGDGVTLASASSQVSNPPLSTVGLSSGSTSRSRSSHATTSKRLSIAPAWASQCADFVTGGGWFEPPNSTRPGRVNFGFNGGRRSDNNLDLKGHVNLVDHGSGDHIEGTTVDTYFAYTGDPAHCRIFQGNATLNGNPYRYQLSVCDYGEPGRDDRFNLCLSATDPSQCDVYQADNFDVYKPQFEGELDGGNIQLHKPACP